MRRILAVAFPLLLAFLLVTRGAEWWSEKWWFAALDQNAAWWTYTKWRAGIFAVAGSLWLAIVGLNLRLAWHQSLALRQPLSLLGGGLQNIAIQLSPSLRMGRALLRMTAWGTGWLAAISAANRFDVWVLLTGGLRDSSQLGFFLYRLPALEWFFGWLGLALGLTFTGCLAIYFWLEAIETGPGVLQATAAARRHLSFLGALFIAWKGGDCALAVLRAPVVFGDSTNGILGVPERLFAVPADQLFAWSALPVAALLLWLSARDDGKRALLIGTIWLTSSIVVPTLAPSFARSLGIGDNTAQREIIEAHIAATREAWGFADVQSVEIAGSNSFLPTSLPAPGQRAPVALWPLDSARNSLDQNLIGSALSVARLHVERDENGLILRAIATQRDSISEAPARELEAPIDKVGALSWSPNRALDSVLLAEAAPTPEPLTNRVGPAPTSDLTPIESLPRYRLTSQSRFALERSSLGTCLVLATRFLDASLATPGLPVMLHLDPVERAQNLAPFVNWSGAVAHPVTLESGVGPQVNWIVEGSFTARTYPNSATLPGGDLWGGINYARQNVTAVFNGTTGESQLYLFDRNEPLARIWDRALPGLFRPIEEMKPELRAAIRPAPAQLNALTRIYARYHPSSGKSAGDEALNWENRQSEWRPILATDKAPTPQWNDALLPSKTGAPTQWQLSAFAPARGRVTTGDGVAALTGIAGVTLDANGSWRWQQWIPAKPLPLPNFVTPPQIIYNSETGARLVPPTRVGVFPTFDVGGKANGFTAFHAQIQFAKDNTPATLQVQAATTGALNAASIAALPTDHSLGRARDLWNAILASRRNSDWAKVAQLETQLNRVLNAPAPKPTPTASVMPAPKASATPTIKPTATPTIKPILTPTAQPKPN